MPPTNEEDRNPVNRLLALRNVQAIIRHYNMDIDMFLAYLADAVQETENTCRTWGNIQLIISIELYRDALAYLASYPNPSTYAHDFTIHPSFMVDFIRMRIGAFHEAANKFFQAVQFNEFINRAQNDYKKTAMDAIKKINTTLDNEMQRRLSHALALRPSD